MVKAKRVLSILLVVIMLMSMIVACGTTSEPSEKPTNGETTTEEKATGETSAGETAATGGKDTLIIATENEPPSLSTTDHDSLAGVFMNLLVYNGLTKIESDTLEVVPDLAESITNVDETTWEFVLKDGIKFHNGEDLKASDVVASIEWAKTFPASQNYTQKIASVEAVDDKTVKIMTDGPYAGLLYDLGYHFNFIVPEALIEAGHDFNADPIGTGPYKFTSWSRGDSLVFAKNEEYFDADKMAKISTLEWRFIPEGTSRTIALEAGEVDFVYEVEPNDIQRLKDNPEMTVLEVPSVVNWFLMLNKDVAPYDNVDFRKAINAAIDRDSIVAAAVNGYGIPNISSVPMEFPGATDAGAEGYDLEKAKAHLAASGVDPATVTLPIICSNETKVKVATIIQTNLSELGINVEIDSMDLGTYLDKTSTGDYISAIVSWSPSNLLTYVQRFHSRRAAGNPGAIQDPEMDALVDKAETTIDDAARAEVITELITRSNELAHQPSLYQDMIFRAFKSDLKGVVPSATGYVYFNEAYWE